MERIDGVGETVNVGAVVRRVDGFYYRVIALSSSGILWAVGPEMTPLGPINGQVYRLGAAEEVEVIRRAVDGPVIRI